MLTVIPKHTSLTVKAMRPWGDTQRTSELQKPFELTLVNDGDTPMTGILNMRLSSITLVGGALFTNTDVVPEPATYALMGLGLVGISLAARRRQQA